MRERHRNERERHRNEREGQKRELEFEFNFYNGSKLGRIPLFIWPLILITEL